MVDLISVSIVSHGHGIMVRLLVVELLACPEVGQILVTLNIPEVFEEVNNARVLVFENPSPKGFGTNHNAAFLHCRYPFFCPLNPDITLSGNPFSALLEALRGMDATVIAPLVMSPDGNIEDSVRRFPVLASLAAKLLGGADGRYSLSVGQSSFFPEWVGGMFMLFRSEGFGRLGGFDERYYLYYEDVDICVRAWNAGMKVAVCPSVSVVHAARRDSRRSFRYFWWHFASMGRYFLRHWRRLPNINAIISRIDAESRDKANC